MNKSRRDVFRVASSFAGLAVASHFVSVEFAAPTFGQAPPYKPSPNAPTNQNAPAGLDGPPPAKSPSQLEANRQLQASIRVEVEKLCVMANELREEMTRVNPSDTLSIGFVKKAQAIEKLAKQIKDHAKG